MIFRNFVIKIDCFASPPENKIMKKEAGQLTISKKVVGGAGGGMHPIRLEEYDFKGGGGGGGLDSMKRGQINAFIHWMKLKFSMDKALIIHGGGGQ